MSNRLPRWRAIGKRRIGHVWIALQQLLRCPIKAIEGRRVDAVSQVASNGSDRCFVADAKPDCVNGVIEVLQVPLFEAETDVAEAAEDIPHVVEEDALDVLA